MDQNYLNQVLENQDYGFLTNVYLEVIHLAEEMPNTAVGLSHEMLVNTTLM